MEARFCSWWQEIKKYAFIATGITIVLIVVTLVFQLANTRTERQLAKQRYEQTQQIAKQRYEQGKQIFLDKMQEVLLQLDFDRNSKLLFEELLFKDETNVSTNPHRSRQAIHKTTLQRQANDDKEALKASLKEQFHPWRTEPGIDIEQQKYLAERREHGISPFKDIKLSRADVEWLLATHENGRGPVDWNDESQREREGLDLRGANLHRVNLSGLPLARLQGGLTGSIWNTSISELDEMTADVLELAIRMKKTIEEAIDLSEAELKETDLRGANLESATLYGAQLSGVDLNYAQLDGASLTGADLKGADLSLASLKKAHLSRARLKSATLMWTQLEGASLDYAQLEGAFLGGAHLGRVDLRGAQLDGASLDDVILNDDQGIGPCLVDVQWGNTNITVVDWTSVKMLGDEYYAHQTKKVEDYREAIRANRQLSVLLGDQGLNEDAARFAYREQVLQRKVLFVQLEQWRWIKSELTSALPTFSLLQMAGTTAPFMARCGSGKSKIGRSAAARPSYGPAWKRKGSRSSPPPAVKVGSVSPGTCGRRSTAP